MNRRDITERKEAAERLRESEERFRLLMEIAQEGFVLSENGMVLDANECFLRMFGYGREEVIGMKDVELIAPEDRELVARISDRTQAVVRALELGIIAFPER